VRKFLIAEIIDFVAFPFFLLPSSFFLPSTIPLATASQKKQKSASQT